ncbi:MAG TPA: ATPase [Anaerolineae bacterium]|nr:ATPase [Anaerolineae bacterium]
MSSETSAFYVLGLDGGGSRTLCVVLDERAQEISRGQGGPSNHQSVGVEAARQAIRHAMTAALDAIGNPALEAACWGMAGLDRPEDEDIIKEMAQALLPEVHVEIVHDSTIALVGGTGGKRVGVVIIAGTGSIAVGYHPSGRVARAGGWGHLLGDEGSGYYIALRGLNTATRAQDGRGPMTSLVNRMAEAVDVPTLEDLANRIYLEGWAAPEVATLAPVVLKAAEEGDEQAMQIVEDAGMELALAARVVIEALEMVNEAFEVVLSGGVFKGSPRMVEIIQKELRAVNPRAEVILPRQEPVRGAGLIALEVVRLGGKE